MRVLTWSLPLSHNASYMKKLFLALLSAIFLFTFVFSSGVSAQEEITTQEETVEISSFELFWPISAGKTMGDSLYFLKSFKETFRGWLIFGKVQKAEYSLQLATKRIVEAEKLINLDKNDLATKSLDRGLELLNNMVKNLDLAAEEDMGQEVVDQTNDRLNNLEIFLPWLSEKNSDMKDKLQEVLDKVKEINQKV